MNKSKVAVAVSRLKGTAQFMVGGGILSIFGLCTLIYLFVPAFSTIGDGFLIFCLVLDFIGVLFIVASRRTVKLIDEFKKCVSIISIQETGSIEEMAIAVGKPMHKMKKDIALMIKKNYFVNAYIDEESNTLVIGKTSDMDVNEAMNREHVECICRNCGAQINVPKGRSAACDYCGTMLRG